MQHCGCEPGRLLGASIAKGIKVCELDLVILFCCFLLSMLETVHSCARQYRCQWCAWDMLIKVCLRSSLVTTLLQTYAI